LHLLPSLGIHWRHPCKLGRYLDECLGDQNSYWIEITGMGLQAQTLSLQGNRAAAAKGIEDRRRVAVRGLEDLGPSLIQNLLVVCVLP